MRVLILALILASCGQSGKMITKKEAQCKDFHRDDYGFCRQHMLTNLSFIAITGKLTPYEEWCYERLEYCEEYGYDALLSTIDKAIEGE